MIKRRALIITCMFSTAFGEAQAYDLATHARITLTAYQQSNLVSSFPKLGLDRGQSTTRGAATDLGRYYFDFSTQNGGLIYLRTTQSYESDFMPDVTWVGTPSPDPKLPSELLGWLLRGDVREDDGSYILGWWVTGFDQPLDDPQGPVPFNRFCNHFFDPINNVKLSDFLGAASCNVDAMATAPVWALGIADNGNGAGGLPVTANQVADPNSRNHFSVEDAREAMWRALTLKRYKADSGAIITNPAGELPDVDTYYAVAPYTDSSGWPNNPTQAQLANAYWATAFRALGDVVHLNQDMAQPQHVRNESHPKFERKFYEAYIESRAMLDKQSAPVVQYDYGLQSYIRVSQQPLNWSGCIQKIDPSTGFFVNVPCSTPAYGHYSDFWSTTVSGTSPSGGGLADYTNHGFFTTAHNFGDNTYTSPSSPNPPSSGGYTVQQPYLLGTVPDSTGIGPDAWGTHMTRVSIWNHAMQVAGTSVPEQAPNYTLDHTILDDYANLLLPRAAAFSAGIINYFFRGVMTVQPAPEGIYAVVDQLPSSPTSVQGFERIRAQFHNDTPAYGGTAQGMTDGLIVAVARFHRDKKFMPDAASGAYMLPSDGAAYDITADEEWLTSRPVWITSSKPVPSGSAQPVTIEFDFNDPIPINATDLEIQFVYRGTLGSESDAVVVQTVDVSEPTLIGIVNNLDYHVASDGTLRSDIMDPWQYPSDCPIPPDTDYVYPNSSTDCQGNLHVAVFDPAVAANMYRLSTPPYISPAFTFSRDLPNATTVVTNDVVQGAYAGMWVLFGDTGYVACTNCGAFEGPISAGFGPRIFQKYDDPTPLITLPIPDRGIQFSSDFNFAYTPADGSTADIGTTYPWLIRSQSGSLPCAGTGPSGCSNVFTFQPPPAVHATIDSKFLPAEP